MPRKNEYSEVFEGGVQGHEIMQAVIFYLEEKAEQITARRKLSKELTEKIELERHISRINKAAQVLNLCYYDFEDYWDKKKNPKPELTTF